MNSHNRIDLVKINVFWLAINFRNQAVFTYFTTYLVVSFVSPDIKNTALGFLNAAGLAVALIVQPMMGYLSDRNTSRLGRRRPFIFIGVLMEMAGLILLTLVAGYWGLLILILYMQFSANTSQGPYQAVIPDMVPTEKMESAASVKAIFELVPTILVGLIIASLLEAGQFNLAILVTGVVLGALMLVTIMLVKEHPIQEVPDTPVVPALIKSVGMLAALVLGMAIGVVVGAVIGGAVGLLAWALAGQEIARMVFIGLGGIVAIIFACIASSWLGVRFNLGPIVGSKVSFTWWIANRFLFFAAITSIPRFAPYFLMTTYNLDREAAIGKTGNLVIIVGIMILLTAIISPWLSRYFNTISLIRASGLIAASGTMVILILVFKDSDLFMVLAGILIGIAGGIFFTTSWAVGTRLVPAKQSGHYLGVSNLAGAGAGIIGMGMAGFITDFLNKSQAGLGYLVIFSGYALMFLCSAIVLRGIARDNSVL